MMIPILPRYYLLYIPYNFVLYTRIIIEITLSAVALLEQLKICIGSRRGLGFRGVTACHTSREVAGYGCGLSYNVQL